MYFLSETIKINCLDFTFLKKLIYRELIHLLSTTLTALFSHMHVLFVEDKKMIQTNTKIASHQDNEVTKKAKHIKDKSV